MTKLVIVDDHEALREGLVALLQHGGLEVVGAAGNVAAGIDLVEHAVPDVAIVDIQLPDGSGIDLTRELLARRPDVAEAEQQLIAAPTLIKKLPLPLRKLVGDMNDHARVMIMLGVAATDDGIDR